MSIAITMPALSPTMETGKIARWLKCEGDVIDAGDVIAEIETDKATMEIEAVDKGILRQILVPAGAADVPVNSIIAMLSDADPTKGRSSNQEKPVELAKPLPHGPIIAADIAGAFPIRESGGRVLASPLARRLARQAGLDYAGIEGSGPYGRIIRKDIERLASMQPDHTRRERPSSSGPSAAILADTMRIGGSPGIDALFAPGSYEEIAVDSMRRSIANRVVEAKQTIPHFYLTADCELDALQSLRQQINHGAKIIDGNPAYKVSVNDFVVKALALALQRVPECNVVWLDERILKFKHADISVAVAVEGGLFMPVIRRAESKSLTAISSEMKDFAIRARQRRLRPEEYSGGSVAVSNLGMYGITSFQPIINPPQAAILGIGAGQERLVARHGQTAVVHAFTVTMSCDHRVVDGAVGARLLAEFKDLIEHPMGVLI